MYLKLCNNFHGNWLPYEQRLLNLNENQREELLEEAESSGGRMEESKLDPLDKLHGHTKRLLSELQNPNDQSTWCKDIWFMFRPGAKGRAILKERIDEEARRQLAEEIRNTDSRIRTRMRRADQKIMLQRLKEQIASDMVSYLEKDIAERQQQCDNLGAWAKYFRHSKGFVSIAQLRDQEKLLNQTSRVKADIAAEPQKRKLSTKYESAMEAEIFLREQLVIGGIIPVQEMDSLLQYHMEGGNMLIDRITSTPPPTPPEGTSRAQAKRLKKQHEARMKEFVRAAKKLRKRGVRGYRLLHIIKPDIEAKNADDQMRYLSQNAYPGCPVSFGIAGSRISASVVRVHNNVLILKDMSGQDKYFVLDLEDGVLVYRDPSKKLREADMHNKMNHLVLAA